METQYTRRFGQCFEGACGMCVFFLGEFDIMEDWHRRKKDVVLDAEKQEFFFCKRMGFHFLSNFE